MAMGRPKAALILDRELREQLESLANSRSLPAGTDRSRMLGAVVGKALEPLHKGTGVIQVLVTLQ